MIPYYKVPSLPIYGNLAIQPFGLLVATGIMSGYFWIQKRGRDLKLPEETVTGAIQWVLIPGFIGAHIFEILFYQTQRLFDEGIWVLFKLWDGISSYGGMLGALMGFAYYSHRVLKEKTLVYSDILIHGFVFGWVFGRIGCSLVVDHPGALTDFFLAFDLPGGARHNLGFYELLYTVLVLVPTAHVLYRRKANAGILSATMCFLYAPARFVLDFFRSTDQTHSDTRYFGLTFAHYCSIALVAYSLFLFKLIASRAKRGQGLVS